MIGYDVFLRCWDIYFAILFISFIIPFFFSFQYIDRESMMMDGNNKRTFEIEGIN